MAVSARGREQRPWGQAMPRCSGARRRPCGSGRGSTRREDGERGAGGPIGVASRASTLREAGCHGGAEAEAVVCLFSVSPRSAGNRSAETRHSPTKLSTAPGVLQHRAKAQRGQRGTQVTRPGLRGQEANPVTSCCLQAPSKTACCAPPGSPRTSPGSRTRREDHHAQVPDPTQRCSPWRGVQFRERDGSLTPLQTPWTSSWPLSWVSTACHRNKPER